MRTRTARRPPHRAATTRTVLAGLLALTALAALVAPAAARAADGDDPNLQQTLPELAVAHGKRVLNAGHVDMGPKFDGGTWRFLIHDDLKKADANATSVWRYPDETVLHVVDQARLTVPDDPAYVFLGADPGSPVWVIPQTQDPDVVWLGWNTQDPEVMRTIDRGISLSLTGVQGPGVVTVYLHSGNFGQPQVLWDSRKTEAQPVWVDVNTHTHANWVFSKPGVYLLRLQAQADLINGSHVTDTQLVRLAVGTATSPDEALAATWDGASPSRWVTPPSSMASEATAGESATAAETGQSRLVPVLIGAIVLGAVGLVGGLTVVTMRGNRAKRRILTERTTADGGTGASRDGGDTQ